MASGLTVSTYGLWTDYVPHSGDTSKEQRIMDAIILRLKTISIANGYNTDINSHVYEWKLNDFSANELPGMGVRDSRKTRTIAIGEHIHEMSIALDIKASGTTAAALRSLHADVVKCVNVDLTWGGLAEDTWLPEKEMSMEQHDRTIGALTIPMTVEFTTEPFNEYA